MSVPVLVVDDEGVTRRLVTYALKAMHIAVMSVENGNSALALAQTTEFALAIVDINLPDIDGFEVIRRLKQMPHLHNVPMIVFTARSHRGDELTATEIGAAGFLYKPFSTQELRDLVTRHLVLE